MVFFLIGGVFVALRVFFFLYIFDVSRNVEKINFVKTI